MPASKYLRQGDFTDDELANKAGRVSQDSAQLDAEFDEIASAVNNHAIDLDVLLRDDGNLQDNILIGHEFSAAAITYLKAAVGNQNGALNWRSTWATATDYEIGDLVVDTGGTDDVYICLVDHTSAVLATDISAGKWEVFVPGTSVAFPSSPSAREALVRNATNTDNEWSLITSNHIDSSVAPTASPTFTGAITAAAGTFSGELKADGQFSSGVYDGYGTITTSLVLDMTQESIQMVDLAGATNAITVTLAAGSADGDLCEVFFIAHTSSDRDITWSMGQTALGYLPPTIRSNKDGVLTMRKVNGTLYVTWAEAL